MDQKFQGVQTSSAFSRLGGVRLTGFSIRAKGAKNFEIPTPPRNIPTPPRKKNLFINHVAAKNNVLLQLFHPFGLQKFIIS